MNRNLPIVGDYLAPEEDNSEQSKLSLLTVTPLYYICLLALSVASIFFEGYFYCFHLLHIVVGNNILIRAVQSVTKNGVTLLWVAALMVVVIFIYSQIAFAFLRADIAATGSMFCETAFQCFLSSLKVGLMSTLGDGMDEFFKDTFDYYVYRAFFDLSFFVLISVVGLNVVFGKGMRALSGNPVLQQLQPTHSVAHLILFRYYRGQLC